MTRRLPLALCLALAACGTDAAPDDAAPAAPPPGFDTAEAPVAEVVDASALTARLPAEVAGRPQAAVVDSVDAALGAEVSRAVARYGAGPDVTVSVADLGSAAMAEMMGYGWGLDGSARAEVGGHPAQTGGGVAGRPYVHRVLVAGRFFVEARSADAALAEAAVRAVDLDGLMALAGAGG